MPHADAGQRMDLGRYRRAVGRAIDRMQEERFAARFLAKDPTLWKHDEDHARVVRNRMGWIEVAARMRERARDLSAFAGEIREAGLRHVVLLGMGGSSLCPDVLRASFRRRPGFPSLHVLDSTDPEAIAAVETSIDLSRALFIVASKSGTTLESQVLYQYFAGKAASDRFVAITDPGTPLEALARERKFRRVFTNPADIGGRYSALSCFGMVPAACLGLDVGRLLERGDAMMRRVSADRPVHDVEPIVLGAALGALGKAGRDKVTFVASERIAAFGSWVEQLIAESTGKEGTGLLPVEGEPLGHPSIYGKDRLFVRLKLRGERGGAASRRLTALRAAGHPCITILLEDLYDLASEFSRWEIATAAAGSILGIDPFDEPNVKESKDNTARVLEQFAAAGSLPSTPPDLEEDGIQAWCAPSASPPAERKRAGGLRGMLDGLCRSARRGNYIALMAYTRMDGPVRARLQALRLALRDRCRVATTLGFGPRFLHSTGQLHKGGPKTGIFIQITSDKAVDLEIPGERYTFGILQAAQAAGDYQSLAGRGYRLARLHLRGDAAKGIEKVIASL